MEKMRKISSLMMAFAIIATVFTGCGSNNGSSSTGSTTGADTAATSTQAVAQGPVDVGMFINHTWWTPKEWTGKVADLVAKETGVRIKATIAADDKQLSLMIASGDLPEMIYADTSMQKRLSDPTLCYDWNSLVEENAPDFQIDPLRIAINTQKDGKFYSVYNFFSTESEWKNNPKALYANWGGLFLRKDMMEKLGNPEINSLEDLDKVLEMAKNQFPDTIPLVMQTNYKGQYIREQVGAYNGLNLGKDGKIIHSIKTPEMKEYYTILNQFYRKGYIIPDNFTFKNEDESYQYAYNGKCFAFMKSIDAVDMLNFKAKEMGKDFTWTQVTKSLSANTQYYNTSAGWSGMFITKSCKNPDKAIKFAQYMLSTKGMQTALWGIEGEDWTMNAEGYPEYKYDISDSDYKNKIGVGLFGILGDTAVMESLGNYDPKRTEFTAAANEAQSKTSYLPALGLLQPDVDSTEITIKSKLDDMIGNNETKMILAKSDDAFNKGYEDILKLAEQIGVSKLEAWANTKYTEVSTLMPK